MDRLSTASGSRTRGGGAISGGVDMAVSKTSVNIYCPRSLNLPLRWRDELDGMQREELPASIDLPEKADDRPRLSVPFQDVGNHDRPLGPTGFDLGRDDIGDLVVCQDFQPFEFGIERNRLALANGQSIHQFLRAAGLSDEDLEVADHDRRVVGFGLHDLNIPGRMCFRFEWRLAPPKLMRLMADLPLVPPVNVTALPSLRPLMPNTFTR